jgi:hypothetical protein
LISFGLLAEQCAGGPRTGREDSEETEPRKPAELAQRLDACEAEASNGGDGHEDGGAGAMHRERVEPDGDAQHTRAGDTGPDCCGAVSTSSVPRQSIEYGGTHIVQR